MSEQFKLIRTTQYNDIQSKISNVLGTGTNDYGYGQPVLSSQVSLGAKISSNQWSNLRTDILKARQHQTGLNETLTTPTTSTTIKDSDRQAYLDMAVLCETNRTVVPPTSQATRIALATGTYLNSWKTSLSHVVTITFDSAEAMRFYFNTGGFFDITASRTGGSTNTKNTSWSTMLTNIGTLRFNRSNTTRIDLSNNTTIISAVGYTGLTTTNQKLYTKYTENATYNPNEYNISVRTNSTNTQIIFTIIFLDASAPTGYGINEFVDGTLTSKVESYRATGVNVSVPVPGASSQFQSTSPLIPSTYVVSTSGIYTWIVPENVNTVTISAIGAGGAAYGTHDSGYCENGYPGGIGGAVQNIIVSVIPGGLFNLTVGTRGGAGGYFSTGSAGTATIIKYNGVDVVTCNPGSQPTAKIQGTVTINTSNPFVSGGSLITGSGGSTTGGCDGSPYNPYDPRSYAEHYNNYTVLGSFNTIIDSRNPHNGLAEFDGLIKIVY